MAGHFSKKKPCVNFALNYAGKKTHHWPDVFVLKASTYGVGGG
jgi:hypothetical protein